MARSKEFDPEQALARARERFHANGLSQTSMQELLKDMGLGQGSFYATFGSKQEVFERALDQFAAHAIGSMVARLRDEGDPRGAILDLLERAAAIYAGDSGHRGCFLVNTVVERAPHDPKMAEVLRAHWERLERSLVRAITAAREAGQLGGTTEPRALARFLIAVIHGMAVRSKFDHRPQPLREIARAAAMLL